MKTSSHTRAWWILILLMVVVIAYAGGLDGGFISDDKPMIADNPRMGSLAAIPDFFRHSVWENSSLMSDTKRLYRPLFLSWYTLVHALSGGQAWAFHGANLLLHLLNCFLLYGLMVRLLPSTSATTRLWGTALFALHPVLVECIAWISGGNDLLMTSLLLGSALCWQRYMEKPGHVTLAGGLFLLLVGLLVKETAVAFVPLLWGGLILRSRQNSRPLPWAAILASAAVLAGYLLLRGVVLHDPKAGSAFVFSMTRGLRLLEYIALAFRYLLWPWPQPFFFIHPEVSGIASPGEWGVGLLALGGALVLFVRRSEVRPGLLVLACFLAPPMALAFHEAGTFALRFLYVPALGLALAATALADHWLTSPTRTVLASLWILPALVGIQMGIQGWQGEATFYRRALDSNPNDTAGYIGLAGFHRQNGNMEEAFRLLYQGLERTNPGSRRDGLVLHLATHLGKSGQTQESMRLYRMLANQPRTRVAGLVGLANNYLVLGLHESAIPLYGEAIQRNPGNVIALQNLGRLFENLGRNEKAAVIYQQMLALPDSPKNRPLKVYAQTWLQRHAGQRPIGPVQERLN